MPSSPAIVTSFDLTALRKGGELFKNCNTGIVLLATFQSPARPAQPPAVYRALDNRNRSLDRDLVWPGTADRVDGDLYTVKLLLSLGVLICRHHRRLSGFTVGIYVLSILGVVDVRSGVDLHVDVEAVEEDNREGTQRGASPPPGVNALVEGYCTPVLVVVARAAGEEFLAVEVTYAVGGLAGGKEEIACHGSEGHGVRPS